MPTAQIFTEQVIRSIPLCLVFNRELLSNKLNSIRSQRSNLVQLAIDINEDRLL
jgi:hypothetical protein